VGSPTITCPECGKHGTITGELSQVGTGTKLNELSGLDLEECEGCREVAHQHGFVVIRKAGGPAPGTVRVRLADASG
jgi:hypothetical protein